MAFSNFYKEFNKFAVIVHKNAVKKGWWDEERNDGEMLCLMHSELSEALEYLRDGNKSSDYISDFSGVEEELADLIIRIMDYSVGRKFDIAGAIEAKITFNDKRPRLHGRKVF